MCVRGDQHLRTATQRQIGLQRVRLDGVVVDQQNAIALFAQSLHNSSERRSFLLISGYPGKPHAEGDETSPHSRLALRSYPPCRAVVAAVALSIGSSKRGLADATQSVQGRNGDAPLVALECRFDCLQRIIPTHEQRGHADGDVGYRVGPRQDDPAGHLASQHELTEADALLVVWDAVQLATPEMIRERRKAARLHRNEQHEPRSFRCSLPKRSVALPGGVWCFQVLVRDNTEHMVGCVVVLQHPLANVVTGFHLEFVDVRSVSERLQLLLNPMSPVSVAARVTDKDVGHLHRRRVGRVHAQITA